VLLSAMLASQADGAGHGRRRPGSAGASVTVELPETRTFPKQPTMP